MTTTNLNAVTATVHARITAGETDSTGFYNALIGVLSNRVPNDVWTDAVRFASEITPLRTREATA